MKRVPFNVTVISFKLVTRAVDGVKEEPRQIIMGKHIKDNQLDKILSDYVKSEKAVGYLLEKVERLRKTAIIPYSTLFALAEG